MTPSTSRPTGWGGSPVERPAVVDVEDAAAWLRDHVVRTPLLPLRGADDVLVKPEVLQPIGSFKLRGALNWAHHLSATARAAGLSTCSAGNTAQALGFAARHFGVAARSMLPDTVPDNKLEAIRGYGVTPVTMPFEELILFMLEERWRNEPQSYLNPWGDPHMIAGSGTVGLEILADLPDVDTVFVPVGGGGLIAGVGSVIKALRPATRIIGVQSDAAPALQALFDHGRPTWVESRPTICEGAAVPVIVDEMAPLLREVVDEVVTVSDKDASIAIGRLALDAKLVVEGAGALPVAAATAMTREQRGRSVCILSGGSISADRLVAALRETGRP